MKLMLYGIAAMALCLLTNGCVTEVISKERESKIEVRTEIIPKEKNKENNEESAK